MYDDSGLVSFNAMYVWSVISFGLGLSLATYHWFAKRNGWSMGEVQAHYVPLAILIGVLAMVPAVLYSGLFWEELGGWSVPLVGLALGLFFTALLRIYSQISLFLAPMSAMMLSFVWFLR